MEEGRSTSHRMPYAHELSVEVVLSTGRRETHKSRIAHLEERQDDCVHQGWMHEGGLVHVDNLCIHAAKGVE